MFSIESKRRAAVLTLLCAALATAQEANPDIETHYRRAQEAQERGQYSLAAEEWKTIVVLAPRMAEAQSNLGMMYYLDRRFDAAISAFCGAVAINPRLVSARLFLGITYYLVGRPVDAIEQFRQTLKLDSPNMLARKWLGVSYLQIGNLRGAITELRLCQPGATQDPELLFHLGRAYSRIALNAFESVHNFHGDSPWDHFVRGEQVALRNELGGALDEFQRVIAADPAFPEIHLRRARLLEAKEQWSEAAAEYIRELRVWPNRLAAVQGLLGLLQRSSMSAEAAALRQATAKRLAAGSADALLAAGAPGSASSPISSAESDKMLSPVRTFLYEYSETSTPRPSDWKAAVRAALDRGASREALRILPSDGGTEAAYWRGRARLASGDADGALDVFLELSRQQPGNPELAYYTGVAAEGLALASLMEFEKLAPGSYRVHQLRAECHAADQDYDGAIQEYRKALQVQPNGVQLHLALGKLYSARHEYEAAVNEFRAELKSDPYSAVAMELLGTVYAELHEPAQARQYLLKARELNPRSAEVEQALGKVAFQENHPSEAIRHFRRALELGGRDDKIYFHLGKALRQTGEVDEARKYEALFRQSLAGQRAKAPAGVEKAPADSATRPRPDAPLSAPARRNRNKE